MDGTAEIRSESVENLGARKDHVAYGTACLNCVRSKTKCSANGGVCDRCRRLNKECHPAPAARKRKRPASSASAVPSKTTRLEEKLDGIVHLLQQSQARQTPQEDSPKAPPAPAPSASAVAVVTDYPKETDDELKACLETYQSKMAPYFPVVIFTEGITVDEVKAMWPFTWLVIRAIYSKNSARRMALDRKLREVLGRQMLVEGARNLDLLHGILVFVGWGHHFICTSVMTTMTHLGQSLAYDLGLLKPYSETPDHYMLHYNSQGCPQLNQPSKGLNTIRKIEERRTVVGLALVSLMAANYYQRSEALQWTPYLDDCLRHLEMSGRPADSLLVCTTRLFLTSNRAQRSIDGVQTPTHLLQKTLVAQLDAIVQSVPPCLSSNQTLKLHILNTELSIYEHCLDPPKNGSYDPNAPLERINDMWKCLSIVKLWFDIFFSLENFPMACYHAIPLIVFSQMAHVLVALYRLTTFECLEISWDRRLVKKELDLGKVLDLWLQRWEAVPAATGLDPDVMYQSTENPWSFTRKKMVFIQKWWHNKENVLRAAEVHHIEESGDGTASGLPPFEQDQMNDFDVMNSIDLLDEAWMREFLSGGQDFGSTSFF